MGIPDKVFGGLLFLPARPRPTLFVVSASVPLLGGTV